MTTKLKFAKKPKDATPTFVLLGAASAKDETAPYVRSKAEAAYVQQKLSDRSGLVTVNQYDQLMVFVAPVDDKSGHLLTEAYRQKGGEAFSLAKKEKIDRWQVAGESVASDCLLAFCEGLLLSAYRFDKYKAPKKDQPAFQLKAVTVASPVVDKKALTELANLTEATFVARDLVNEPVITLNAEQLSKTCEKLGKKHKFSVDVLDKAKIRSLKMGGLLSVNAGSNDPPTFTVMEYKPRKPTNQKPYVLVGKGVTYDTGGLSLKPSNSMDTMKSDMGGAAAVIGAMVAVAMNKLPIHVVALVPATDNRPGSECHCARRRDYHLRRLYR